jgi:arylsulfatase A-like enzyme/thioredoxin-like negative regulator of GroEL
MKRFFLISLILVCGCHAPAGAQANIVLITLDTTRADRMGFLGSGKGLTPHLDGLARESAVFTRAYAQAPITTVSHASILTGCYPVGHGVDGFAVPLPAHVPSLPDLLRQRGYRTGAFVGAMILDPVNGLAPEFNRGFEVYDAGYRVRVKGASRYETLERRAADVVARALAWLGTGGPPASRAAGSKPFFLWVHVFDPHEPYDAPGRFRQKFADPYDAEIAYTDDAIGRLLAELKSRQLWDNTLVAVMADHGESFGEHGERTHGVFLYDSTIHVPLVIKFPQQRFAGKRAGGRTDLVNVAPTALEAAGVAAPRGMQGQSLAAMLARDGEREAPAFSETKYPAKAFGWSSLAALRTEKYLFVSAPRRELYDLVADPGALRNLAAVNKPLADRLAQQLENFAKFHRAAPAAPRKETEMDPRLAEKLAALGYVAAGGSGGEAAGGADPKDKIGVANQLHAATQMIENHEQERAIPLLRRIVASDPQIFAAQMKLGAALFELGQFRESVAPLRRATDIQPDSGQAQYALGKSLVATGDFPAAAAHLDIAATRLPKSVQTHFLLGSAYASMRQPGKAVSALRTAAQLDPRHYNAHLALGRILAVEGQPREGMPYLERAVQLRPESREAQRFLADAYAQVGRTADAARVRARAETLPRKSPAPAVPPN